MRWWLPRRPDPPCGWNTSKWWTGLQRSIREARTVRADCVVPEASPVFEGHFPGYPLLPGVLMIETMAQTGGWLVLAVLRFAAHGVPRCR